MKVLFIEKNLSKASPLITHSEKVRQFNGEVEFADFSQLSTKALIARYQKADIVVMQHYGRLNNYEKRLLAFAPLIGTPILRHWAGTDALNVVERKEVRHDAKTIDPFVSINLTSSHQGLIEELKSADITCVSLPKIVELSQQLRPIEELKFIPLSVLVYLPASRREFYGSKQTETLIKKFKNVQFCIIGDDEHMLAHYDNVTSHGWVSESQMESIWENVGLVLRITEHDGTPRMMYEALSRGKYFIHNNKHLDGIWYAKTNDEIEHQVQRYIELNSPNAEGVEFVRQHLTSKPDECYFNFLSSAKLSFKTRLKAAVFLLRRFF